MAKENSLMLLCGVTVVHGNGRGKYWLGAGGIAHRKMPASAIGSRKDYIAQEASRQIGETCRWHDDGLVETIDL